MERDGREGAEPGQQTVLLNPRGVATLTTDVQPGLVVAPMGDWLNAKSFGTVNALTPERYADYGRAPTFSDTLAEVSAVATPA